MVETHVKSTDNRWTLKCFKLQLLWWDWIISNRFYLNKINIDSFLAHVILAVVSHNFERESYNKSIFGIFQKLLRKISLLHIIEMEEQVFAIYIWNYEAIILSFIEEFQSSSNSVINISALIILPFNKLFVVDFISVCWTYSWWLL